MHLFPVNTDIEKLQHLIHMWGVRAGIVNINVGWGAVHLDPSGTVRVHLEFALVNTVQ